ncbi:MAG: type 2 isopentenyl-diphosphate Delta-isomerase [Caldilineaceae bacterium]
MSIDQRKADHIRINLEENVSFPTLTTGLERFRFTHQALPELDLQEVDTSVGLFGKRLRAPILVSSMTGGTADAERINRNLAAAAEAQGLAMGVGSQRAGLEQHDTAPTFRVRAVAPRLLLFANIGAVQLNYGYSVDACRRAVEMIEADALILHLNPLQEVVQAEGDTNWRGLLHKIAEVCQGVGVPVITKEVGWGISQATAQRLIEAGVSAIDVAGAGGTSWSQVEMHRAPTERLRRLAAAFGDWGIPTAESLQAVAVVRTATERPDLPIFASGGIRTGLDIAKCVALGADLVGLASPFLKRAVLSAEAVCDEMDLLATEVRIAMFCSGCATLADLRRPGVLQSV